MLDKNKQSSRYPAKHMPRAQNKKQDSSFSISLLSAGNCETRCNSSCPQLSVSLLRSRQLFCIQNSVSSECLSPWSRDTDCNSQMIIFLFFFFLRQQFQLRNLKAIIVNSGGCKNWVPCMILVSAGCGYCRYAYFCFFFFLHVTCYYFFPTETQPCQLQRNSEGLQLIL